MEIEVANLSKSFGTFVALDGVDLKVPEGKLVALLGPSGSGKTTLLRIVAGLERADSGDVRIGGESMSGIDARKRNIGFVFQHYSLFRNMTVAENIGFSLKVRGRPFAEREERVKELLALVRLSGLEARYPAQLSGGQRQRIALARALAARPNVLLLDEPFGALDALVRQELRTWLRRLHDEIGITSVFVTHDQEEALEVADHIVVMNRGRIEQEGSPDRVFEHPATPFVMQFLGLVNIFHGRVEHGRAHLGSMTIDVPEHHDGAGPAAGYVRPHELDVFRTPDGPNTLPAVIRHISGTGPMAKIELVAADNPSAVHVLITRERLRELDLRVGEHVFVSPKHMRVFVGDYSI